MNQLGLSTTSNTGKVAPVFKRENNFFLPNVSQEGTFFLLEIYSSPVTLNFPVSIPDILAIKITSLYNNALGYHCIDFFRIMFDFDSVLYWQTHFFLARLL